jgi:voltage-gated potassium channel
MAMISVRRSKATYHRYRAVMEMPLLVLSLLWLPVLIVPLVMTPAPAVDDTLTAMDYLIWAIFAGDYLVGLYLTPDRRHYFRHHLVDLSLVLLPVLRPLRVLRVLRLLSVVRVGATLMRLLNHMRDVLTHRKLHLVLISTAAITLVSATLELAFEQGMPGSTIQNFGDSLWWAIVTITTVGYGDRYPVTAGGRGVAFVLMLVGIGLIGVLTASIASYFVQERSDKKAEDVHRRLERIEALLSTLVTMGDK